MGEPTRTGLLVVAVVLLALLILPLLGGGAMMGGMMGSGMMGPGIMGGWGGGGAPSPWWPVFSLVPWLLVVAGIGLLVVWALRQASDGGAASGSRALDILKERYARGELAREQYEQMRRDLE